jgi:PAS domain S-box-containing protein
MMGAACIALCYWAMTIGSVDFAPGRMGLGAIALLLLGAAAGLGMARHLGQPIQILTRSLHFAEARHHSFWEQTPESLFTVEVTPDARFVFAGINPAHERLTGLRASEIVGREPAECLSREIAEAVTSRYRECVRLGRAITYDEKLDLPGGVRFWRTSLSPVRDADTDRIVLLFGSARDVTQDIEASARLLALNNRLQSILASVSDCYCTLDRDYRMTAVNAAALEWLGLSEEHALGTSFADTYSGPYECAKVTRRVMEDGVAAHVEVPSGLRPGRWLDYHVYPSMEGVSVFFRDITEARAARERLEQVSRQLLASQEDERRRIASELHDSTAQHIVSAGLSLMRLPEHGDEQTRAVREEIERSLDEALREIRVFTYLLHPPGLHSEGLGPTLHSFVEGFGRRAGLATTFHGSPALGQLPDGLQKSLLRVVQEALSNTHRHATATRVAVSTKISRGTLFMTISDNGCGVRIPIGTSAGDAHLGVGIPGMRARLQQFGGDLKIRSRPGRTTLYAVVPFAQAS